jgi:hypothetical protein
MNYQTEYYLRRAISMLLMQYDGITTCSVQTDWIKIN